MLTDSSMMPPLISACCNRHSATRVLAPNGSTMTTTAGWIFSLPMGASRSEAHGPPADPDMLRASLNSCDLGTLAEMMKLAQSTEKALRAIYQPDGMNLGMNLGRAAGAGVVGHLH